MRNSMQQHMEEEKNGSISEILLNDEGTSVPWGAQRQAHGNACESRDDASSVLALLAAPHMGLRPDPADYRPAFPRGPGVGRSGLGEAVRRTGRGGGR